MVAGTATSIDHADRRVAVTANDGRQYDLAYDLLVVTAGAVTRTFPIPGLAEEAIGMKNIEEAIAIRDRLLTAFDRQPPCPRDLSAPAC